MYQLLTHVIGAPATPPGEAGPITLVIFTITMFLAYDLSYYIYHYMQHKVPLLWELHKVHHSAQVMVGVTKDRVHPVGRNHESLVERPDPRRAMACGCSSPWIPSKLTVFGLNVYALRNTVLMMDFVRHTHLKLSYGRWLNTVFLCPHYHQLHHSNAEPHWTTNFGLTLSVWDRMFGTLMIPEPGQRFVFGLANGEHDEYQSLTRLHVVPLLKMSALIRDGLHRRMPGLFTPRRRPPRPASNAAQG